MAKNPQRRTELADAGLRVLAAAGARGLTHRAVDTEAGAPTGTASNYFRSREDLFTALGERIFERFAPDPGFTAPDMAGYLRYLVERTTREPLLTRALIELRLEATRRPGLAASLGGILRKGYRADVEFHIGTGLPGGAFEIALLHYAIDGLLLDMVTTSIDAGVDPEQAISAFADRLIR